MNSSIITRFDGRADIEFIKEVVTVAPEPLGDLAGLDKVNAAEFISKKIGEIYVPDQFALDFISEVVTRAKFYCDFQYPDDVAHCFKVYNPPVVGAAPMESAPMCLTGLAGIGKTQAVIALMKVMPPPVAYTSEHFIGIHELKSFWYSSARDKAGGRQMLRSFISDTEVPLRAKVGELLIECRRRANRDGVSLLILEELQHLTSGSGVARIVDILLTVASLGRPTVFVSNYSLLHKLLGSNSEDKQRILSDPKIMLPDEPRSLAWVSFIKEVLRVCGENLHANLDDISDEIYRSTFGIKRLAVQLVKLAYLEARKYGRAVITIDDVVMANLSVPYSSNRRDVQELHRIAIQPGSRGRKSDLYCPFDLPEAFRSNVVQFSKEIRDDKVRKNVFYSSLGSGERKVMTEMESLLNSTPVEPKPSRRKAIPRPSKEELEKAFLTMPNPRDRKK